MNKFNQQAIVDISTRASEKFNKEKTKKKTKKLLKKIRNLQKVFFASKQQALLVVLQGIDASGKDGVINTLSKGLNITGCMVNTFKAPTEEELSHDFLWRIQKVLPAKGMIGIFNRSHYEDLLVTRVENIIDDVIAQKRFQEINAFEKDLTEKKTTILKFFLHVSKEKQAERLQDREENPTKFWKYKAKDWQTNQKFDVYQKMYQDALNHCNSPEWIIVPADQNWYKEYVVAKHIYTALKAMRLSYPPKTEQ